MSWVGLRLSLFGCCIVFIAHLLLISDAVWSGLSVMVVGFVVTGLGLDAVVQDWRGRRAWAERGRRGRGRGRRYGQLIGSRER